MIIELKKVDAVIVVALIIIAGFVLYTAGYIPEINEKTKTPPIIIIPEPEPEIVTPTPPVSLGYGLISDIRCVTPADEGKHFDKLLITREWWYYSVIFDDNSDLAGWSVHISFNHMALLDFLGSLKPNMFVVTLHGPNGEEYGGVVNKERGLLNPTLKADTPGVNVRFGKSWAEGLAPEWHIHVEDETADNDHVIKIDLDFFAPSDPLWIFSNRLLKKSESKLASYAFFGCNATGTVQIDNLNYDVKGVGYHEHTWTPGVVTTSLFKGWDWCQITLDNGWNIYYSNYMIRNRLIASQETKINPFGTIVLTTDQGRSLTVLEDIDITISDSSSFEDRVFLFVKMPSNIAVKAKAGIEQVLLLPYDISLNLEITPENTYTKIWKLPSYVGMKVGRSLVKGTIKWKDTGEENSLYEVELNGLGSSWSMRSLL